ncbi:MAG TPA: DUF4440 domain-containing protein [Puia sp.]|nr:DUF4440 domain-containing protein [Puia sp.]
MKKEILAACTLLLLTACTQPKTDTKAEGEKLMATSREWSQSAATGNVDKILSYWADDAVVMSSGQPSYKGKNEIRKMVDGAMKIPGFKISWEPQSTDISESGDMGYLLEKQQISMNDSTGKSITQHVNTITVWKKQADGAWKCVADISTNEP